MINFFVLAARICHVFLARAKFRRDISPVSPVVRLNVKVRLPVYPSQRVGIVEIVARLARRVVEHVKAKVFIPVA